MRERELSTACQNISIAYCTGNYRHAYSSFHFIFQKERKRRIAFFMFPMRRAVLAATTTSSKRLSSSSGLAKISARMFSAKANMRPSPPPIPTYMLTIAAIPVIGGVYTYYRYLDEVPLTKRKRWIATSAEWEQRLGDQEYKNLRQQYQKKTLPKDHRASITVHRVGLRIAKAAQEFSKKYELDIPPSKPTFTIIRSEQANAFVLPGNHIFVMTGLFQFAQTEDELAAVLGHEMAHTLARHVGEKISGNAAIQFVARLSFLVDPSGALFSIILPSAAFLRELPHSRTQESEADRIGMHLASLACYDPQAAQRVFQRMQAVDTSSAGPPEFLSTHPSHESRIQHMEGWLAETRTIFQREEGYTCRHIRSEMEVARTIAVQRHKEREAALALRQQ
jgi:predicted Zn-dependent protease